jgi:hypothetical protein
MACSWPPVEIVVTKKRRHPLPDGDLMRCDLADAIPAVHHAPRPLGTRDGPRYALSTFGLSLTRLSRVHVNIISTTRVRPIPANMPILSFSWFRLYAVMLYAVVYPITATTLPG